MKKTKEDFINNSKKIHGNKFDYSKVIYIGAKDKVKIICLEHGEFEQTPTGHLSGRGCYECSGKKRRTLSDFIEKSNIIHKNRYDYSLVLYKNKEKKVKIICPIHGVFEQVPKSHLNGHGCHYCFESIKKTTEDFILDAIKIHGNRFDYSVTKYTGAFNKIKIICKDHGIFETIPHNHLYQKDSCQLCKNKSTRLRKIERVCQNKLDGFQIMPAFNKKACGMFDQISEDNNISIQHAMNGGEYYIKELGYFLDGYDKTNNVVYEYYENHHYKNGKLREKDVIRESEIKKLLNCEIISIKD